MVRINFAELDWAVADDPALAFALEGRDIPLGSNSSILFVIDAERFKLLGKYRTPKFRYGQTVECLLRGPMRIVGLTNGRIPWPIGKPVDGGMKSIVLFKDLARAVQAESAIAVRYWWGVGASTVQKWRHVFDVPHDNGGTRTLRRKHGREDWFIEMRAKAHANLSDPARAAKISAAMRGKGRPPELMAALHASNRGRKASEETRRKMSEAHRKRGTRPPWLNKPWEPWEDELVRTLSVKAAAEHTGRTEAREKQASINWIYGLAGLPDCLTNRT